MAYRKNKLLKLTLLCVFYFLEKKMKTGKIHIFQTYNLYIFLVVFFIHNWKTLKTYTYAEVKL